MRMKKNEAPVTSKSNQVLPTTGKNVKTTKSQATETVKVSANNNQKSDTTQNPVQKTENKSECPPLIAKQGDANLRRGANEAPVTSKSNQVLPTTGKNVKTTKSQATETVKMSANNDKKADTTQNPVQKTENKSECSSLIAKSGDTDLRRGAKELGKVVEKMGMDPHNGAKYAFSNMKNSVKLLQEKEDGTLLLIKKTKNPIEGWPEYQPPGKPGHTVAYNGKDCEQFLEKMGFPKKL